jgi:hypothetical protein
LPPEIQDDQKPIRSRRLDCVDADAADRPEQFDEDMELIDLRRRVAALPGGKSHA